MTTSKVMIVTQPQLKMLKDLERDGEPTDYADFADRAGSALGWRNRERVLNALIFRQLIDNDLHLTELGKSVVARGGQCP